MEKGRTDYGTKRIRLHMFDQKAIDGFQLSKDVILNGKITDENIEQGNLKYGKWRMEN